MYLVTTRVTKIDHLTIDEAKREALRFRGLGLRSEIISDEEARKRYQLDQMQDLTKINDWSDIK